MKAGKRRSRGDIQDDVMASGDECQHCGEGINDSKRRVYFYGEKEVQQLFSCHSDCFQCNYCSKILTLQNYFLSPRGNFYCWQHSDAELINKHEHFFRELKLFRQTSKDKLNALRTGKSLSLIRGKQKENAVCQCRHSSQLVNSHGYWIECTLDACPFFNNYNRVCDSRNFDVSEWKQNKLKEIPFRIEHYEEEIYEACFIGNLHNNYYSVDELIGPVVLSLRKETVRENDCYRALLRSSSHIIEGVIPLSCFCTSKVTENHVLEVISKELKISSALRPFSDSPAPSKLLFLDKVMSKDEFKVGVVFINGGQVKEEEFFTNTNHNVEFEDFLSFLGDRVKLRGFKGYSGGLDTAHGLTGEHSIYKEWKKYKIMYHVSTLLPMEEHDDQKLQRKRHIGNDIVCVVFLASGAQFEPSSIKSNFLHVYIIVQPQFINAVLHYKVTLVARDLVIPFGPPIPQSQLFRKDEIFHNWLLTKIINAERASYRSPKFSAMQERTRRQLLEEIVHEQACKEIPSPKSIKSPFQRFRPLRSSARTSNSCPQMKGRFSHSNQFPSWIEEKFDSSVQLQRDLKRAFSNGISQYHDVFFNVGTQSQQIVPGVKAILAARSRVFHELLFPNEVPNSPLSRRASMLSRTAPSHLVLLRSNKRWSELWKKTRSVSHDSISSEPSIVELRHPNAAEFIVTEFEAEEFKALLEFMHSGSCVIHIGILTGLACAAECYEVSELLQICVDCFARLLNPYNACLLMTSLRKQTLKYNVAGLLQRMAIEYIEQNVESVHESFDMSSLSIDCLQRILSANLKLQDTLKFEIIKKWYNRIKAHANYEEASLCQLLSYVNLSALSVDERNEAAYFMSQSEKGFAAKDNNNDILLRV